MAKPLSPAQLERNRKGGKARHDKYLAQIIAENYPDLDRAAMKYTLLLQKWGYRNRQGRTTYYMEQQAERLVKEGKLTLPQSQS